ncbi:MAG: response regulator transcription factor [Gammaproteobacteria bacterium]|nr:response regulator transcription factor [Gammaproteobacteria bacterium]
MQVLLIEDDPLISDGIVVALKRDGFAVTAVESGAEALRSIAALPPQIVVLDLGLPDMDGLQVLRDIRAQDRKLPVLVLTARDSLNDKITGLDSGADDYLTKPFETSELLARLRVLGRRLGTAGSAEIAIGEVTLDTAALTVRIQDQPVTISPKEYNILRALMENAGRIMTRSALETRLYSWGDDISSNTIEVHIHNLRKKLPDRFIKTVHGMGYTIAKS